jgi:hypothetical protein
MYQKITEAGAGSCGAVETGNHSKNGATPKSLTSRGKILKNKFFNYGITFLFMTFIMPGCSKEQNPQDPQDDNISTQINDFPFDCTDGSELVKIEYMGDSILCNYVEGQYIVEGDIVLRDDNTGNDITLNDGKLITRAAIINDKSRLWSQGKVYYFFNTKDDSTKLNSEVQNAMYKITSATNIFFIPVYTQEAFEYIKTRDKGYVIFSASDSVNSSFVGNYRPEPNKIKLVQNDNAALHEICHTLGLIHEHSRPDRNNHVNINWNNIKSGKEHNFYCIPPCPVYKEPSDKLDFGSVMMYNSWAFSKDEIRLATITKKDGSTFYTQRENLSENDKSVINEKYPHLPVVTPDIIIHTKNIQPASTSCELTGELIFVGAPAVTKYGICYRESNGSSTWIFQESTNKDNYGRYKCQLINLKPNTAYEALAYVIQNGQPFFSDYFVQFFTPREVYEIDFTINEKRESIYSAEWENTSKHCNTELALQYANEYQGTVTSSNFCIDAINSEMNWSLSSTGYPDYYPVSIISWHNGFSVGYPPMNYHYTYWDELPFVWIQIRFDVDITKAKIDEVIRGTVEMGDHDFYNQMSPTCRGTATLTRIE